MKKIILLILSVFTFTISCKTLEKTNSSGKFKNTLKTQGVIAQNAMVVTAHPEATEVGIKVLKNGGNAIDAMVAVHFALTVCYPRAGNIGGGGFMVYRAANGQKHTLDFRETAPKAASKNMYLNKKGDVIDRLSLDGHLAVGVPGSVDGLWQAHQKFGNLPWAELVFPAIELAEKGYPLTPAEVDYMAEFKEQIKQFNTEENLFTNNTTYKADDQFIQTDLARILKRIGNNGRAGFYEGGVAHMIVEEMKRGNGIITLEDLKNYEAKWREPLIGNYKNEYNIISMPPPSSGGICLLQMLEMLENVPLKEWGFNNEQTIHTINEVEKLAYADRAEHIGDPDFYDVPLEELTDSIYLLNRFNSIDTEQATLSNNVTAGNFGTNKSKTTSNKKESEQTTHYSIVDEERNAVSVTTTLNSHYGSKVLVGGAGFFLNNEMDDFSAKPGVPNQFGLVGKEANAITAGKRMLSSMTPTIVEKNGALFMVLGTPGGSTIITSVLQNIINVVEHDMTMQESVNSLRFHHQWKPDTLYHEPNAFDKALISKLEKRGHTLIEKEKIGRVDAILIRNNKLEGAADTRGEDNALGF